MVSQYTNVCISMHYQYSISIDPVYNQHEFSMSEICYYNISEEVGE